VLRGDVRGGCVGGVGAERLHVRLGLLHFGLYSVFLSWLEVCVFCCVGA
jgi:hypothetical protein